MTSPKKRAAVKKLPPMARWKLLSSEVVHTNKLFSISRDRLQLPDRRIAENFVRIHSNDWVMAPSITKEGELLLVEQYRHGTGRIELGLVAGFLEKGEKAQAGAKRECREETGYGKGRWTFLGTCDANNATHSNTVHFWLGRDLVECGALQPDEFEVMRVRKVPLKSVRSLVEKGCISGSYALIALYFASRWIQEFRL